MQLDHSTPIRRTKLTAGCTDSIESKITPLLRSFMAEYVPDSPVSVASSDTRPWSPLPPLKEGEDVLVPYWDIIHEEFFRREDNFREALSSDEQHLRDFWHNQHLMQRE